MHYLKSFLIRKLPVRRKVLLIFLAISVLIILPPRKVWSSLIIDSYDNYDPAICQIINATVIISTTDTFIVISSIDPQHPPKEAAAEIYIVGERIDRLSDAWLIRDGQADIVGTIIDKQPESATIIFDLTSAVNGSWDLKLINDLSEVTIKHNAVEITGG